MTAPEKALRSLLLLVAFGMVLIGALQIGLEYTRHRLKGAELDLLGCTLWGALGLAGLLLSVVSGRVARKLAGEDDDDLPPLDPTGDDEEDGR
jgi:hypothetical protein